VSILFSNAIAFPINNVYAEKCKNISNATIEQIVIDTKKGNSLAKKFNSFEISSFLDSDNINAICGKSEKEIEQYFATVSCGGNSPDNTKGGVIYNPVTYLHNTVGKKTDKYTITKSKICTGVGNRTCTDLGGHSNCTLTALYNAMVYFRSKGYSKIPSKQSTLYSVIKTQATKLGYNYKKSEGLSVTKNDNLVENTWKEGFGYSTGDGSNNYLWVSSTATNLIDKGKPFLFSLASGAYYDHTVTVCGYKIYKNERTKNTYTFLVLNNGWTHSYTYLAWTNTSESYLACLTSIITPNKKS